MFVGGMNLAWLPTLPAGVWVFLGGGLGALLRWGCLQTLSSWGWQSPYMVGLVNIIGCWAMGWSLGYFSSLGLGVGLTPTQHTFKLWLTVGVLGGFTTFSSFAVDMWQLRHQGQGWPMMTGVVALYVLCTLVAFRVGQAGFR